MQLPAGITPSLEDYLEAIYSIIRERGSVKAKDIAARLGVSRPSVSGQLKALSGKGLINHTPYDIITLTDKGERLAKQVRRTHKVLREFLVSVLGVDVREADEAACRMEHAVTPAIRGKLEKFLRRYSVHPSEGRSE